MPPMEDEPKGMPEPPMDDTKEAPEEGNNEIDDIFGKLNTEKQAAVIKYAKSMVDDNEEGDNEETSDEAPEDGMPDDKMKMESKENLGNLVNEIINSILDDDEEEDSREDDKIRNTKVTKDNPYISKR